MSIDSKRSSTIRPPAVLSAFLIEVTYKLVITTHCRRYSVKCHLIARMQKKNCSKAIQIQKLFLHGDHQIIARLLAGRHSMTQKILGFVAAGAYLLAILLMLRNGFGNTADIDFGFVVFLVIGTLFAAIGNVVGTDSRSA